MRPFICLRYACAICLLIGAVILKSLHYIFFLAFLILVARYVIQKYLNILEWLFEILCNNIIIVFYSMQFYTINCCLKVLLLFVSRQGTRLVQEWKRLKQENCFNYMPLSKTMNLCKNQLVVTVLQCDPDLWIQLPPASYTDCIDCRRIQTGFSKVSEKPGPWCPKSFSWHWKSQP